MPAGISSLAEPQLPASVRRASELAAVDERWQGVLPTAYSPLDAQLPGGGWPLGALVELIAADVFMPVWPLLLPAMAAQVAPQKTPRQVSKLASKRSASPTASASRLVLVGHEADGSAAPGQGISMFASDAFMPYLPALAAWGVAPDALLWLRARTAAEQLWCTEQALRSQDVRVVLAWLPRASQTALHRLHIIASHTNCLFVVVRPESAAALPSPAVLRLRVGWDAAPGLALCVELLKRRGPALAAPLRLLPPAASPLATLARVLAVARRQAGLGFAPESQPVAERLDHHALDRLAKAA